MIRTTEELFERIHRVVGLPIAYRLSGGGMDPESPTPADRQNSCDCSGLVAWALGLSRKTEEPLYVKFNGGWINTDAMAFDIGQDTGLFHRCDPCPGAVIVYPGPPARRVGHCGIILTMDGLLLGTVAHCSSTHWRTTGAAIQITPPDIFLIQPDTVIGYFSGLSSAPELEEVKPVMLDIPYVEPPRPWWRQLWRWLARR